MCKKYLQDYQSFLPQILYRTLYLGQQHITYTQCNNVKENTFTLPTKIIEIDDNNVVHFISLEKKLKLPSEKFDQYCLQIQIGAVKCLQLEKQVNFIVDSMEYICDLCLRHSEVNLEALKHLTECMSLIKKEQWNNFSKCIYKVLMSQINHHLPSIHDQCILLFKKCLEFEDLDYLLNIIMTEISWSLRIKCYMLAVIAPKYGVKRVYYYFLTYTFKRYYRNQMSFYYDYNFRF